MNCTNKIQSIPTISKSNDESRRRKNTNTKSNNSVISRNSMKFTNIEKGRISQDNLSNLPSLRQDYEDAARRIGDNKYDDYPDEDDDDSVIAVCGDDFSVVACLLKLERSSDKNTKITEADNFVEKDKAIKAAKTTTVKTNNFFESEKKINVIENYKGGKTVRRRFTIDTPTANKSVNSRITKVPQDPPGENKSRHHCFPPPPPPRPPPPLTTSHLYTRSASSVSKSSTFITSLSSRRSSDLDVGRIHCRDRCQLDHNLRSSIIVTFDVSDSSSGSPKSTSLRRASKTIPTSSLSTLSSSASSASTNNNDHKNLHNYPKSHGKNKNDNHRLPKSQNRAEYYYHCDSRVSRAYHSSGSITSIKSIKSTNALEDGVDELFFC